MNQSSTVYQVSDLASEMCQLMEASYPDIWIEGEVSSLSTPSSGHLYFNLKDEHSQLRCAMFRRRASISRYRATAGDLVRVRAKISVYTARGDVQCIVQHIEEAGEGILQRRFEELKTSLSQQGLFNQAHKQAIPKFPKHIGIITSPTGAAVKDILSTLKRRCPSIPVTLYPCVVQGDSAARSLVQAIEDATIHRQCDVLILSRGGGSLEDLWCFNNEQLAHTIHQCPIPIVSGVGHEVDITITDLVADHRAPTPTAAAEILSPDANQLLAQVQSLHFRLPRAFNRLLERRAQNIDIASRQLIHPKQQLSIKSNALQQIQGRLQRAMHTQYKWRQNQAEQLHQRLRLPHKEITLLASETNNLAERLFRAQSYGLNTNYQRFNALGEQLNLVSPLATLERGFAIARDDNGVILRRIRQVSIDSNISLQLNDGKLQCKVLEINK